MKLSQYNHVVTSFLDDRYLAFNALTGSIHVLDEAQLHEVDDLFACVEAGGTLPDALTEIQQQFIDAGFVINDTVNEVGIVHDRYYNRRGNGKGLSLTVTPTVGCNFGCGYCFQKHSNRRIGPEDIESLKQFVRERLAPNSYLAITWFGGEPLTAFNIVEELAPFFAGIAAKRSCSFSHSMITNGYLLDVEKAKFLAQFPQFKYAQITLDGSPFYHNQRRHTLGKNPTFHRILENVKTAAAYIPISIRVNVDRRNAESLPELLTILKEAGLENDVGVYLGHVWEYTEEVEQSDFLTKEEFAAVQAQFRFMKFRMGFDSGARLPKPRQGTQCVADNPNGYVVAPDGLLFNCWNEVHLPAAEASGRYDGVVDLVHQTAMRANQVRWETYDPFTHNPCRTCDVAPLCMSGCPWESRKRDSFSTGYCTPLRFNMADQLRLYHLEMTTRQALGRQMAEPEVDACTVPDM